MGIATLGRSFTGCAFCYPKADSVDAQRNPRPFSIVAAPCLAGRYPTDAQMGGGRSKKAKQVNTVGLRIGHWAQFATAQIRLAIRADLSHKWRELDKSPPRAVESFLFQPTTRVRKTVARAVWVASFQLGVGRVKGLKRSPT